MLSLIISSTPTHAGLDDWVILNVHVYGVGENCPEEDLKGI